MSKFNVELKSFLHLGLSKPEFYSNRDLIYKIEKIMVRTDISDQLRKVIIRYKRNGNSLNVMRQSARLMINPITLRLFSDTETIIFRSLLQVYIVHSGGVYVLEE